jgi:hypothetical protein
MGLFPNNCVLEVGWVPSGQYDSDLWIARGPLFGPRVLLPCVIADGGPAGCVGTDGSGQWDSKSYAA